jgi:hypothetical protein
MRNKFFMWFQKDKLKSYFLIILNIYFSKWTLIPKVFSAKKMNVLTSNQKVNLMRIIKIKNQFSKNLSEVYLITSQKPCFLCIKNFKNLFKREKSYQFIHS